MDITLDVHTHEYMSMCISSTYMYICLYRYNQRVVPVLSYVAQFAVPPDSYKVQSLAHRALHYILRIPLNCFSMNLTNTIGFCFGISPYPISCYCASVRYRFAVSEALI